MESFFWIEPEVSGQLGPETEIDSTSYPPKLSYLHYRFDGWFGDDLVQSFPCFLVTERLARALTEAGISGIKIDDALVDKSELFLELNPELVLPAFKWLKPVGIHHIDDAGLMIIATPPQFDCKLVVSKKFLSVIRQFTFSKGKVFEV